MSRSGLLNRSATRKPRQPSNSNANSPADSDPGIHFPNSRNVCLAYWGRHPQSRLQGDVVQLNRKRSHPALFGEGELKVLGRGRCQEIDFVTAGGFVIPEHGSIQRDGNQATGKVRISIKGNPVIRARNKSGDGLPEGRELSVPGEVDGGCGHGASERQRHCGICDPKRCRNRCDIGRHGPFDQIVIKRAIRDQFSHPENLHPSQRCRPRRGSRGFHADVQAVTGRPRQKNHLGCGVDDFNDAFRGRRLIAEDVFHHRVRRNGRVGSEHNNGPVFCAGHGCECHLGPSGITGRGAFQINKSRGVPNGGPTGH